MPEVRCVDQDGKQIGVIPTKKALMMAQNSGLDLVEVSPRARPPVCRIMDYGKYKYEQGKKTKDQKKHSSTAKVKEIQFHANVGDHDYQTKLRHARKFLDHGHKLKVRLVFRGRENAHREFGFELINKLIEDCKDCAVVEQSPRLMGRNLQTLLSPIPAGKRKSKSEGGADS